MDGAGVAKAGAGLLSVTRLDNLPTVNVSAGTIQVAPNGTTTGVSKIGNLTLGSARCSI